MRNQKNLHILKYFKNKKFLILGGTGSFGKSMVLHLLNLDVKKITVFSRDELKQFEMRNEINSNKVFYQLGDVRDKTALKYAMKDVDFIFFAAALKQVPACEFSPDEAVKTNFLGALNLIDLADEMNIKKIVFLSTDKAVEPINSMGMTKSLMEKLVSSKSLKYKTKFLITRYGNVIASRGSVIPYFVKSILQKGEANITSREMTRFMMKMDDAIDLVLYALMYGKTGYIYIKKCPAARILDIANSIGDILNKKIRLIDSGIRVGEKIHETLISKYEMPRVASKPGYFEIQPEIKYNYENFFFKGVSQSYKKDYSSQLNLIDKNKINKLIKPIVLKLAKN